MSVEKRLSLTLMTKGRWDCPTASPGPLTTGPCLAKCEDLSVRKLRTVPGEPRGAQPSGSTGYRLIQQAAAFGGHRAGSDPGPRPFF